MRCSRVRAILLLIGAVILTACAQGQSSDARAQLKQAFAAYNRHDYTAATQIWRSLADQGNKDGQYNLALAYRDGEGVPQDYGEAVRLYRLAAAQNDPSAMNNLGAMYDKGLGVERDSTEAARWYRKAAGLHLAPGTDTQNLSEAAIGTARNNIALAYRDGIGVPKDPVLAYMWFKLGVDVGDEDAPANLKALTAMMDTQQVARGEKMYADWRADAS